MPCGLIPGASGGGLLVEHGDEMFLIGTVSTVTNDLIHNGLTPVAAIRQLVAHSDTYRHAIPPLPFSTTVVRRS